MFLGENEIAVRLGIESQFGDTGLVQVTPCCLFFNSTMREIKHDMIETRRKSFIGAVRKSLFGNDNELRCE